MESRDNQIHQFVREPPGSLNGGNESGSADACDTSRWYQAQSHQIDTSELYNVYYTKFHPYLYIIPQLAGRTKETACLYKMYKEITKQSLGISQIWIPVSICI